MSPLNHLKDYRVVKAVIPLQGDKSRSFDGVAKVTTAPQFEVTFLSGQLPTDQMNLDEFCQIKFDVAGQTRSIKARIDSVPVGDKLLLEMVDSCSYVQKREHFRVDAELSVSYWLVNADNPEAKSVQTTVNISGGGIRFPFTGGSLPKGARLGLEIVVTEPQPAVINCTAEVVGIYDLQGSQELAVKYTDIEEEDQDAIVAYCLSEQRKQLRLKVKVLGGAQP